MDYKEKYKEAKQALQKIEKAFNERQDADDFCDTLGNILKSIRIRRK